MVQGNIPFKPQQKSEPKGKYDREYVENDENRFLIMGKETNHYLL
jgi:hypothetical protein